MYSAGAGHYHLIRAAPPDTNEQKPRHGLMAGLEPKIGPPDTERDNEVNILIYLI